MVYLQFLNLAHLSGNGVGTLLILLLEGLKLHLPLFRGPSILLGLFLELGPQLVQCGLRLCLQSMCVLQMLPAVSERESPAVRDRRGAALNAALHC